MDQLSDGDAKGVRACAPSAPAYVYQLMKVSGAWIERSCSTGSWERRRNGNSMDEVWV